MKVVVVQLVLITAAFLSGVAAVTVMIRAYNATGELDLRSNPLTLGTRVLLSCDVTGLPEGNEVVNYRWYHNCAGRPDSRCEIQDGDPYYRVEKDTLLVDVTTLDQGGRYYCNVDSIPVREVAVTRQVAVAGNAAPFLYTPTSLLPEHSVLTDVQQATGRNGQQWITCRSGGEGTRPEIWMGSELVVNYSTANSATIGLDTQRPNGLFHCLSAQSQREYFSLFFQNPVTLPTPTASVWNNSMWTFTSPDGSLVERYIVEFECRVRNITFVENYMSVSANGGTGRVATNVSCFGRLGQLYRVKVRAVSGPNISRALVCAPDGQCREEEGGSQILTTQLTITSTSTLADNMETEPPPPPPPPTTTAATTTAAASAATTTTATIAATTTAETTAPPTTKSTTTAVTTTTAMTAAAKTTTATTAATTTTATTTATTTSPSTTATTAAATTTTSATIAATTTMATTGVTTTTATTSAPPLTTTTTTAKTTTATTAATTAATTTIATTAATTTKATTKSTTTSIPTSDRPSSSPSANAPSSGPQHDWTFIGVGAGVGMFLLLLVLSLVVVLIVVVVVVRRAAHKQKNDPKMGGNRDPNSIEMQEKETGADTHYKDARIYENVVEKNSGEVEDRVNDNYYSYVLADMYDTIQNVSTPSVEEPSDSVTDGVHVYANAVTDTGHYAVPSRIGNMTETGDGGNRSGDVEKEGCYYNVVDLSNEELANQ